MKNKLLILLLLLAFLINGQVTDFGNVDFHKADSIANHYHGESLTNLPLLSFKLTNGLNTDVEKFRALYVWVCKDIQNDYYFYKENKRKRENLYGDSLKLDKWNNSSLSRLMTKLVTEKQTVCTGYAYLLKELANLAGIECIIVDGYARTASTNVDRLGIPNHSWNAVKLDNKWYLCDPTWSSGTIYSYGDVTIFVHEYNDGYFLTEPRFFLKNHFPLDSKWTLVDDSSTETFLDGPILYNDAYSYGLNPIYPTSMNLQIAKNDSITFSFSKLQNFDFNQVYFQLSSDFSNRIIEPELVSNSDETIELKFPMYKRGFFDLHVKLKDKVLMTYTVLVTK